MKQGLYTILKQYIESKEHIGQVCWILGNICSGKPNSFCYVIMDEAIMNKLCSIAVSHSESTTRDYALNVLFKIVKNCEKYQMIVIMEKYNILKVFSFALMLPDLESVQNSIAALNRIHTILDTEGNLYSCSTRYNVSFQNRNY